MRDVHTPLRDVIDSFLLDRYDLSAKTQKNYRYWIQRLALWCEQSGHRLADVGDVNPASVQAYLGFLHKTLSPQSARSAWVALRSLSDFLAKRRIHHDGGDSVLRQIAQPKVKDESRRALTDREMWLLLDRASEGEQGQRDSAVVWMLLGCGLRREELVGLRLCDVDLRERKLHVRASTSKSVHSRDVTIPIEVLKVLDLYVVDHRKGDPDEQAPLFTDRRGGAISGDAIRKLFDRLKVRTGIRDLCAHMLRHTWATNYHRSDSGSRFDLMTEGGWTTGRMVERYTKARPFEERRRAPSPFTASRKALAEKRTSERSPSQQRSGLSTGRAA